MYARVSKIVHHASGFFIVLPMRRLICSAIHHLLPTRTDCRWQKWLYNQNILPINNWKFPLINKTCAKYAFIGLFHYASCKLAHGLRAAGNKKGRGGCNYHDMTPRLVSKFRQQTHESDVVLGFLIATGWLDRHVTHDIVHAIITERDFSLCSCPCQLNANCSV